MAAHPDRLAEVAAVALDLEGLGRFDAALALDQAALDRIARAPWGRPAFSDQPRQLARVWDSKSVALVRLGRFDEAVQAMRAAVRPSGDGGRDLGQTLRLARLLLTLGRPDQALAALAPFERDLEADPSGAAWARAERACAWRQLGRAGKVAPQLAWLAADRRGGDDADARLEALACAGAPDDLAAELVAELKDPDAREAALVRLSEFDPPRAATPVWAADLARMAAIRARPDVRAAVAAVGHTERIPLCGCGYFDPY
jgi:tetratricopeptide (TPR) repeat protein